MTKQEYEAKVQLLKDTYICDSDYFGRLVDLDIEYIASLEADVANLNDWLTAWKESLSLAQAEIAQLQADNRSLVEQMNKMAMRMEHKSGTTQRRKA